MSALRALPVDVDLDLQVAADAVADAEEALAIARAHLAAAVGRAHERGVAWSRIAALVGMSVAMLRRRYAPLRPESVAAPAPVSVPPARVASTSVVAMIRVTVRVVRALLRLLRRWRT